MWDPRRGRVLDVAAQEGQSSQLRDRRSGMPRRIVTVERSRHDSATASHYLAPEREGAGVVRKSQRRFAGPRGVGGGLTIGVGECPRLSEPEGLVVVRTKWAEGPAEEARWGP